MINVVSVLGKFGIQNTNPEYLERRETSIVNRKDLYFLHENTE